MLFKGLRQKIVDRIAYLKENAKRRQSGEKIVFETVADELGVILGVADSEQHKLYVYHIKMDGSGYAYHIIGDQKLDLRAAVKSAMRSLPDNAIVDPVHDVLKAIVDRVCDRTGFHLIEVDQSLNIERMYWREADARVDGSRMESQEHQDPFDKFSVETSPTKTSHQLALECVSLGAQPETVRTWSDDYREHFIAGRMKDMVNPTDDELTAECISRGAFNPASHPVKDWDHERKIGFLKFTRERDNRLNQENRDPS